MSSWSPGRALAWAATVEARLPITGPFELLELTPTDDAAAVQAAYHAIAGTRHPDLFRGRLTAADAERLMRVYAQVTAAYAELRDPDRRRRHLGLLQGGLPPAAGAAPQRPVPGQRAAPPPRAPAAPLGPVAGAAAPTHRGIAPRAMASVRRAESSLAAGDAATAVLYLRKALADDPGSAELRARLEHAQARLKR